jgi:amino acid transporter
LFIQRYFEKPIYVFGSFGIFSLSLGVLAFIYMIYLKIFAGISMIATPLPTASSMFFLVGVVSILLGLLAEIAIRIYYESQAISTYSVRSHSNKPVDKK